MGWIRFAFLLTLVLFSMEYSEGREYIGPPSFGIPKTIAVPQGPKDNPNKIILIKTYNSGDPFVDTDNPEHYTTTAPPPATGKVQQFAGYASPVPILGQPPPQRIFGAQWAAWTHWSLCRNHDQVRARACRRLKGYKCTGPRKQTRYCMINSDIPTAENGEEIYRTESDIIAYQQLNEKRQAGPPALPLNTFNFSADSDVAGNLISRYGNGDYVPPPDPITSQFVDKWLQRPSGSGFGGLYDSEDYNPILNDRELPFGEYGANIDTYHIITGSKSDPPGHKPKPPGTSLYQGGHTIIDTAIIGHQDIALEDQAVQSAAVSALQHAGFKPLTVPVPVPYIIPKPVPIPVPYAVSSPAIPIPLARPPKFQQHTSITIKSSHVQSPPRDIEINNEPLQSQRQPTPRIDDIHKRRLDSITKIPGPPAPIEPSLLSLDVDDTHSIEDPYIDSFYPRSTEVNNFAKATYDKPKIILPQHTGSYGANDPNTLLVYETKAHTLPAPLSSTTITSTTTSTPSSTTTSVSPVTPKAPSVTPPTYNSPAPTSPTVYGSLPAPNFQSSGGGYNSDQRNRDYPNYQQEGYPRQGYQDYIQRSYPGYQQQDYQQSNNNNDYRRISQKMYRRKHPRRRRPLPSQRHYDDYDYTYYDRQGDSYDYANVRRSRRLPLQVSNNRRGWSVRELHSRIAPERSPSRHSGSPATKPDDYYDTSEYDHSYNYATRSPRPGRAEKENQVGKSYNSWPYANNPDAYYSPDSGEGETKKSSVATHTYYTTSKPHYYDSNEEILPKPQTLEWNSEPLNAGLEATYWRQASEQDTSEAFQNEIPRNWEVEEIPATSPASKPTDYYEHLSEEPLQQIIHADIDTEILQPIDSKGSRLVEIDYGEYFSNPKDPIENSAVTWQNTYESKNVAEVENKVSESAQPPSVYPTSTPYDSVAIQNVEQTSFKPSPHYSQKVSNGAPSNKPNSFEEYPEVNVPVYHEIVSNREPADRPKSFEEYPDVNAPVYHEIVSNREPDDRPKSFEEYPDVNAPAYHEIVSNREPADRPKSFEEYPDVNAPVYHEIVSNREPDDRPKSFEEYPDVNAPAYHEIVSNREPVDRPKSFEEYPEVNAPVYHEIVSNRAPVYRSNSIEEYPDKVVTVSSIGNIKRTEHQVRMNSTSNDEWQQQTHESKDLVGTPNTVPKAAQPPSLYSINSYSSGTISNDLVNLRNQEPTSLNPPHAYSKGILNNPPANKPHSYEEYPALNAIEYNGPLSNQATGDRPYSFEEYSDKDLNSISNIQTEYQIQLNPTSNQSPILQTEPLKQPYPVYYPYPTTIEDQTSNIQRAALNLEAASFNQHLLHQGVYSNPFLGNPEGLFPYYITDQYNGLSQQPPGAQLPATNGQESEQLIDPTIQLNLSYPQSLYFPYSLPPPPPPRNEVWAQPTQIYDASLSPSLVEFGDRTAHLVDYVPSSDQVNQDVVLSQNTAQIQNSAPQIEHFNESDSLSADNHQAPGTHPSPPANEPVDYQHLSEELLVELNAAKTLIQSSEAVEQPQEEAEWSQWDGWSKCKCGQQSRTRKCSFRDPYLTSGCLGISYEVRACTGGICPTRQMQPRQHNISSDGTSKLDNKLQIGQSTFQVMDNKLEMGDHSSKGDAVDLFFESGLNFVDTIKSKYPPQIGFKRSKDFDGICRLSLNKGAVCDKNSERMWYFDRDYSICKAFIFAGCEGNANRFENESDCTRVCGHLTPNDTTSEQKRRRSQ